jgi:PAS domain S-box-containing protein
MIGTHTDVTQAVLDRNELIDQANLIEAAFFKSMHPCSIISLEGNFIKVNSEFVKVLGYSEEELLKKKWQEITHPEDLSYGISLLNRFISGDIEEVEIEKRFICKNGRVIPTRVRGEILRPRNLPAYFLMHLKDMTFELDLIKSIKMLESIGG